MRAVQKSGLRGCSRADGFVCVAVNNHATTPAPGPFEVLIRTAGSGLNPDELTILTYPVLHYTLGIDVAGTVVAVGPGVSKRIAVGDHVWSAGTRGGMGEYAIRPAATCGVLPAGVNISTAGTLPTVGMTVFGALRSAGAPWHAEDNVTVLITAGTGGTGYTAVQLAKILGATRVVTAATGEAGMAFARSLGADQVVDYRQRSVYDAVPDHSVDVVLSNHKSNTTALRAMVKLKRHGGVYVTLDGDVASAVPSGVRQVAYDLFDPSEAIRCVEYLDALAAFLASGRLRVHVQATYGYNDIREALEVESDGQVLSKLAIIPA